MNDNPMSADKKEIARLRDSVRSLRRAMRHARKPDKSKLGGVIQSIREDAGLSMTDAARLCGIHLCMLSRFEMGTLDKNPTIRSLKKLSALTKMPLSALFALWESHCNPKKP
jgi:DNA-binding transcriptional regulator YiaG